MEQHNIGTSKDLALYRLDSARECLESARLLLSAGMYKAANNRGYYAIFNAVNAAHALSGKAYKRHKDAIGNFNKDYVKTGIFPRDIGRKIAKAEEIRHASDYDDFYIAVKAEAEQQVEAAAEIIRLVEEYVMQPHSSLEDPE